MKGETNNQMKKEIKINANLVKIIIGIILTSYLLIVIINCFGNFEYENINYKWEGNIGQPNYTFPEYYWSFTSPIQNSQTDPISHNSYSYRFKGSPQKEYDKIIQGYLPNELSYAEKAFAITFVSLTQYKYWIVAALVLLTFMYLRKKYSIKFE